MIKEIAEKLKIQVGRVKALVNKEHYDYRTLNCGSLTGEECDALIDYIEEKEKVKKLPPKWCGNCNDWETDEDTNPCHSCYELSNWQPKTKESEK